jgi:hypothetical protein
MIRSHPTLTSFGALILALAVIFDGSHSWAPRQQLQRQMAILSQKIDSSSPPSDVSYEYPSNGRFHTTRLFSSLSVPPESRMLDLEADNRFENRNHTLATQTVLVKATHIEIVKNTDPDDDNKQKAQQKQQLRHEKNHFQDKFCPFTAYLFGMKSKIKNRKDVANRLDDEVKRMESRYYGLVGDNLPQILYPYGMDGFAYRGKVVRPTEQVYVEVCAAYSRAGLGMKGAQLAEDAIARYEKLNPEVQASAKMMGFAMKAWISVQDMDRAEYWLRRIEAKYQMTHDHSDIPGGAVYTPFVEGLLTDTTRSDGGKAADMSIEIIEKMNKIYMDTKENFCRPGRVIYSAAMKCQPHGYGGMEAFERMEGLFRQLQEAYKGAEHPKIKPTAETALPLFYAASNCYGLDSIIAAKKAEEILREFHQLYNETSDVDFCPSAKIYQSMLSMYMQMNRLHKFDEYAERVGFLIDSIKETGVMVESHIVSGALNRRLQAADALIPIDPLEDPVKTRYGFNLALNTFKMFHGENPVASPNTSTYEIFLRACNRLPVGEVRSKLAIKAFTLCRSNGLVSPKVCRQTYQASPEWALMELKTTEKGMIQNTFMIPDVWKKNVPNKQRVEKETRRKRKNHDCLEG